jgi:hypothetical protein
VRALFVEKLGEDGREDAGARRSEDGPYQLRNADGDEEGIGADAQPKPGGQHDVEEESPGDAKEAQS